MTEIRKAVLEVCKIAETSDEYSYSKSAVYPDYDLTDIDEWKNFVRTHFIHAMLRYNKPYRSCNKRAIQEGVQFKAIQLRDATAVTATASWIEKNFQTGSIHLQTVSCMRAFGNTY